MALTVQERLGAPKLTGFPFVAGTDMALTQQERIEIILMSGERSSHVIAQDFNARHPERHAISHNTVSYLIRKFSATGNVADRPRSGPPRTATDEETSTMVLTASVKSPKHSTRQLSATTGILRSSVMRILHTNNWHPFKLQLVHNLSEDDPDRRMEFGNWDLSQYDRDPQFPASVLFTDEAHFYLDGEMNRQNMRYWSDANPHAINLCKTGPSSYHGVVWHLEHVDHRPHLHSWYPNWCPISGDVAGVGVSVASPP